MKEIKNLLEKKGEMENARKGLVVLLDASLDVLQKVASDFSPGEELHRAISNYDAIHKAAKNILPEGELEKINHRYREIQKIWT